MKVTIDSAVCLKNGLTLENMYLLLAIKGKADIAESLDNLVNRDLLLKDDSGYYLSEICKDTVDKIIYDSNGGASNEERLVNLAKEMQKLFPAGKMPGTPYYYKCNTREVALKLKKFFDIHGNYPDEKILDATKRFIASFNGNYKFLPLIKYFITKNKTYLGEDGLNHTSEVSPLADFLENKDDNDTITASDDWIATVRN